MNVDEVLLKLDFVSIFSSSLKASMYSLSDENSAK